MLVYEPAVNWAIDEVKLNPADFYLDRHKAIFEVMLDLYTTDKACDSLTVTEALVSAGRLEEAGGNNYVAELAEKVAAPGNARHHAEIVKETSHLRRLLLAAQDIEAWVGERKASARELSDQAETRLFEVAHKEQEGDFRKLDDVLFDEADRLHKRITGELKASGVPTGFDDLDEKTGGLQPSNLIILAARPSVGKSAFAANIAENIAVEQGRAVAFFSLEMSESELAQRFIASQSGVKGDLLRKGRLSTEKGKDRDWKKVTRALNQLNDAPLYIDVTSDLGLLDLRAKARRLHEQEIRRNEGTEREGEGLSLIVVDYLQLMRMDERIANRAEQVGQVSRGLKLLSSELGVPLIALSQLNRANENRPDKRPMLSDLRESGNIEQDADLVLFLYRDDVYKKDPVERDGTAEVLISKNRNGPIGMSPLVFMHAITRFVKASHEHTAGEGSPVAVRAESETV
ncbi:MAG: replicative DNA helicase [Solirubrobacterales bacterium]|nr:replicative DNA helicase [Solirubrobacterales bacterium]MCB0859580.1 replicative DNA helicase [Solirubrobacterales bacterium]